MNLEWHCRLVARMIKNDPDATIKNYYSIVDKEDKNAQYPSSVRQFEGGVEVRNFPVHVVVKKKAVAKEESESGVTELETDTKKLFFGGRIKKKKYMRYEKKNSLI
jgi:hypothetical protein